MKKLEQIQVNKLVSRYGGVGSIIETNTNGSLIVCPYDDWKCFNKDNIKHQITIVDNRLLKYVRDNGYPYVERLLSIPTPDLSKRVYKAGENDINNTVVTDYFPMWYYCSNCRKLKLLKQWKREWETTFKEDESFSKNPPACCYCSKEIETNNDSKKSKKAAKNKNRRFSRRLLQQVRFVMASLESGELQDVPFNQLWANQPNGNAWKCEPETGVSLEYRTLPNGDGLNAIFIKKVGDDRRIYLSEIERNYIIQNEKAYKMVVKGSNSIYFPNIVRSLWIPNDTNYSDDLNIDEFLYFIDDNNYRNGLIVKDDLFVRRTTWESKFISRINAIERLKETSVMLSYSRFENGGTQRNWYNVNEGRVTPVKAGSKRPFRESCEKLTWMPAVEQFGEGILFEVDCSGLGTIKDDIHEFVHTFCHIIMKEMEFQCGYPLTSLKEKIYVDMEQRKAGFMVYTIAGSEGSYGGLVSLTNDNRILKLIERGAERAKNCPNDPICINEQTAHCFACLDLPETSCIEFNHNLNRKRFLAIYHNISSGTTPLMNPEQDLIHQQVKNSTEEGQEETGRPMGLVL